MIMKNLFAILFLSTVLLSCDAKKANVPTVAFMDAFQDNTIAKAKEGFFAALAENGFDEKKGIYKYKNEVIIFLGSAIIGLHLYQGKNEYYLIKSQGLEYFSLYKATNQATTKYSLCKVS